MDHLCMFAQYIAPNGHHFGDAIFERIFIVEDCDILIQIWLIFYLQ